MTNLIPSGLGWHRDLPDPRDFTPRHDDVASLLRELKPRTARPKRVDLREYCADIEDQQNLRSSAAHACVGVLQYFERRAYGKLIDPSRMFIYKTSRRLMSWEGDSGANLRTTWKAIVRFGVPPEESWPYELPKLDQEPDAFAYSFARECQSVHYVRLDARGAPPETTLETVKSFLAAGLPSAFGFSVCTSVSTDPDIPYPTVFDAIRGGQAAVAVGYNDNRRVRSDKGALLIRNSWGKNWGEDGYGWLPYAYVREQLAADFWTLLEPKWLASGEFTRPR